MSVAVLALVALGLSYSAVQFASAAGTDLSALRATVEGSLADGQGAKLAEASDEISLVRQSLETPIRIIRWTGRLGAAVPWLPLLSLESSSVEAQVDRIDSDLEPRPVCWIGPVGLSPHTTKRSSRWSRRWTRSGWNRSGHP